MYRGITVFVKFENLKTIKYKMKKTASLLSVLFIVLNLQAQINMNDSTAQVIAYWNLNEKQIYKVTHEKYKVNGTDTTYADYWKYVVDITVKDSTANSYTIDWFYHEYEIEEENEILKKLSTLVEDMTITIRTDETGMFQEVVNWQDIQAFIFKATEMLREETKDIPNLDAFITQIENMYTTKESIEAAAIKEIQLFHTFHGAKYKLGEEYNSSLQIANLYDEKPFDADAIVWLDEINQEDNNFVIRMNLEVNSEQLTKTTFDYLTQMAKTMKTPAPKWEEFPTLKNETFTASRIHGSGWPIYSIETKEISAEGQTNIEETIIEIQ